MTPRQKYLRPAFHRLFLHLGMALGLSLGITLGVACTTQSALAQQGGKQQGGKPQGGGGGRPKVGGQQVAPGAANAPAPSAAAAGAAPPGSAARDRPVLSGAGNAVEGDLIMVNASAVRLYGIDAPDPGQTCKSLRGKEYDCSRIATEILKRMVGSNTVTCQLIDSAGSREPVGICSVNGVDLGAAMVARGWAFAYRMLTAKYASTEAYAQSRKRGMWGGRIEYPWLWRDRQLAAKAAEAKGKKR